MDMGRFGVRGCGVPLAFMHKYSIYKKSKHLHCGLLDPCITFLLAFQNGKLCSLYHLVDKALLPRNLQDMYIHTYWHT